MVSRDRHLTVRYDDLVDVVFRSLGTMLFRLPDIFGVNALVTPSLLDVRPVVSKSVARQELPPYLVVDLGLLLEILRVVDLDPVGPPRRRFLLDKRPVLVALLHHRAVGRVCFTQAKFPPEVLLGRQQRGSLPVLSIAFIDLDTLGVT